MSKTTKLLFDIGNSRIKWVYSRGEQFESEGSIAVADISAKLLQKSFGSQLPPDTIWISNVGSMVVLDQLNQWFSSEYKIAPKVIEVSQRCCGITNHYHSKETLGVDRWLAAIGARSVVEKGHVIIIDAGTAVTIDWLSESNQYEGGTIVPGVDLMHDALTSRTAGIKSEFSWAQHILGKTTLECVNSGVSFAIVGAVERIVQQLTHHIAEPVSLILTGGSAKSISMRSSLEFRMENNLVLLGVAKVSNERA